MLESRINRVGGATLFFYDNDKVEQISLALYNSSSDTYSDVISRYSITYDTAANETTSINGRIREFNQKTRTPLTATIVLAG
jgi:hypothetical protein